MDAERKKKEREKKERWKTNGHKDMNNIELHTPKHYVSLWIWRKKKERQNEINW